MPFCFWKVQTYPLTNSFDVPSAELAKRLRYTKAEPGRASHGCVAWDRFLKLALSFHWTICSCFAHVAGNVARIFWWIFWAHDYLRDFRAFLQLLPHRQVSKLSLPLSLSFLSFYLSDSPRHLSLYIFLSLQLQCCRCGISCWFRSLPPKDWKCLKVATNCNADVTIQVHGQKLAS